MAFMKQIVSIYALSRIASAYNTVDVDQFMMKNIDPIVIPGLYQSHMHAFFGSDVVNKELSTSAQLREGCSTAANTNDFSVYWVPVLYHVDGDTHIPIPPERFVAYYNFEKEGAEVNIPQDFSVVAGNSAATTPDDIISGSDITWLCEKEDFDADGKDYAEFPRSTCSGGVLQAVVWFPDCVNPDTLDSAYSNNGECGDGMSFMPQLRFSIRYDVSDIGEWDGVPPLELACGPSYCMHGDFINGWTQEVAEEMVLALTSPRQRQSITGDKTGHDCEAADADPGNGTDDYATSLGMMGRGNKTSTERRRRRHGDGRSMSPN